MYFRLIAVVGLLAVCNAVGSSLAAETVELNVAPSIRAVASFSPGDDDMQPIMIVHGFLQTRQFSTVKRLGDALAESGYPVLIPSLSLGIDRRAQSLACEAIHTHSMQQDVDEIGRWVDWLHQRTGRDVMLIGHSAGSVQSLIYLTEGNALPVSSAALISLTYFGDGRAANETRQLAEKARRDVAAGRNGPDSYGLAFCKNYVTTPENFLSYYDWDKNRLTAAAANLKASMTIIFGQKDDRIDREWLSQLQASGVDIIAVPGANHFFDQAHEFDLLERVEALLE